jgi:hypothetical protein
LRVYWGRGNKFGPLGPAEFGRFVRDFSGGRPLDYVGGASPRVKVCGGVYTSTEYARHCMPFSGARRVLLAMT